MDRIKYPRTPYLPWSHGIGEEERRDKLIAPPLFLRGEVVVVTEKMDGGNVTVYPDGYVHARSLDGAHHPSLSWVKGFAAKFAHELPEGMRVVGENMYARHTIPYKNLRSFFLVHSIWVDDTCLEWRETVQWCSLFGLETVPVIETRVWTVDCAMSLNARKSLYTDSPPEGYVVRRAGAFTVDKFADSVAKYVGKEFLIPDEHWTKKPMILNHMART
jgi:hypothetical protein